MSGKFGALESVPRVRDSVWTARAGKEVTVSSGERVSIGERYEIFEG